MTVDGLIVSALRGESPRWPSRKEAFEAAVLEAAGDHGVAALLSTTMGVRSWPERVRTVLANVLRVAAVVEGVRRHELRELLAEFSAAGVRPLLMKGAHLAYAHYPHPWVRPRLDTDLIVIPVGRTCADDVLRRVGYRPTTDFGGELVSHQFQYQRPNRYGFADHVDLHWRIANPHVFAGVLSFGELENEAERIDTLGPEAYGLSVVHALVLACVHRVAHHHNSDRLIWLYDIHLLAKALGPDDWERLLDFVVAKGLGAVCRDGLARTESCFGIGAPQDWLGRLEARSSKSDPTASFLRTGRSKLDVLRSDLQALQGWRSKMRILREHLFPPVAYIRRTSRLSSPASVPLAYAIRIAKGVGKWSARQ